MPSQNDIEAQLKLLATNRRTLEHYIIQRDTLGSAHVPPMVSHGIREARENIQNIKTILRQQKVVVEDLAIDEEVLPDTLTNKNERFKSGYLPPTALKKLRVTELVGLIATVIACIAAVVVVPEIRLFLGLDRSIIPSTTTQTAHIPITSLPSSTIIDSSSSNIPTVPLPNRTAALEPTLAPHTPTPAPTTSVEPTLAPRTPTLAPTTSIMEPATVISIKQPLDTNSEGFVAILESIEIEPGSFMRWNFEFWNKSGSGLDVTAGTSSYVVDDLGNRYAMTTPLVEGLTPGVKIQKKLKL